MMFRLFAPPTVAPPWAAKCDRITCLNAIKLRPGPRARAIAEATARGWLVGGRARCVACPLCADRIARGLTGGYTTRYDLDHLTLWQDEGRRADRIAHTRHRAIMPRVHLNLTLTLTGDDLQVDMDTLNLNRNLNLNLNPIIPDAHRTATAITRAIAALTPHHRRGV